MFQVVVAFCGTTADAVVIKVILSLIEVASEIRPARFDAL
jgi:hypothetical protein